MYYRYSLKVQQVCGVVSKWEVNWLLLVWLFAVQDKVFTSCIRLDDRTDSNFYLHLLWKYSYTIYKSTSDGDVKCKSLMCEWMLLWIDGMIKWHTSSPLTYSELLEYDGRALTLLLVAFVKLVLGPSLLVTWSISTYSGCSKFWRPVNWKFISLKDHTKCFTVIQFNLLWLQALFSFFLLH